MQEVQVFEEDNKWFHEKVDFLRKQGFAGKFVAIKDKKVIATDKNIEVVVSTIEQQGQNPAYIVLEFVYPKETVILL